MDERDKFLPSCNKCGKLIIPVNTELPISPTDSDEMIRHNKNVNELGWTHVTDSGKYDFAANYDHAPGPENYEHQQTKRLLIYRLKSINDGVRSGESSADNLEDKNEDTPVSVKKSKNTKASRKQKKNNKNFYNPNLGDQFK